MWIPITDRFPDKDTSVLGWDAHWEQARVYFFGGFHDDDPSRPWWCMAEGVDMSNMEEYESDWYPTHWMPLPPPPPEKEYEEIFEQQRNKDY